MARRFFIVGPHSGVVLSPSADARKLIGREYHAKLTGMAPLALSSGLCHCTWFFFFLSPEIHMYIHRQALRQYNNLTFLSCFRFL